MASRLNVQDTLESILGGTEVYYQPPETQTMKYPAITYKLYNINNRFADNDIYMGRDTYEVVVIDRVPDNAAVMKLRKMVNVSFLRNYISDNLNHTVFVYRA